MRRDPRNDAAPSCAGPMPMQLPRGQLWPAMQRQMQKECSGTRRIGAVLGFSNGAYLSAKWHEDCLLSQSIVTVVSGGLGSRQPNWSYACRHGPLLVLIWCKRYYL